MFYLIRMLYRSVFVNGRPWHQFLWGAALVPLGAIVAWAAMYGSSEYEYPYFALGGVVFAIFGIMLLAKGIVGINLPKVPGRSTATRPSSPQYPQQPYANPLPNGQSPYPPQPYTNPAQYAQQPYNNPAQYAQPQQPYSNQVQYGQSPYPPQSYTDPAQYTQQPHTNPDQSPQQPYVNPVQYPQE